MDHVTRPIVEEFHGWLKPGCWTARGPTCM